ncbi:MAG: Crp/Fnr family transcriptional regulator [Chitinophagaceae bacterium]|nr:MAG: Crp/Fnr family transcriptional regulator [Chitinophagaceae bacterium]
MEALKRYLEQHVALEPGAWEAMQEAAEPRHLKRREFFLRQDQVCRHVGFIASGYVRLFYLKDGLEITKDFNFEQSFCGSYASFSLQQPSRFNVVAMEDTELYAVGRSDLYRLFDTYPSLQKMGRLNMEHMFIRKELRESAFLLDGAERRYLDLLEQHPQVLQRVPLKYIASYLGLTAETVSRIRRSLQRP